MAAVVAVAGMSTAVASAQTGSVRVMPLGDSITSASTGWNSFRRPLWHALQAGGYCVDFVGAQQGVHGGMPPDADFDLDHQGISGIRTDQAAAQAFIWADAADPDIVMVHLGTNDLWQQQSWESTVQDLETVIDELRLARPTVTVLLAQIISSSGQPFVVDDLNAAIPGLATQESTPESPVIVVDLQTGFDPAVHTYDGVHPNAAGEQWMADRWYSALQVLLIDCVATWQPFGDGCAGTAGVPSLAAPVDMRPLVGQMFHVELSNIPPTAIAAGLLGFSNTDWDGRPLPFDLGVLGMDGCTLFVAGQSTIPLVNVSGVADWAVVVAPNPLLVGAVFYQQAIVLDPGVNGFGAVVSNAGEGYVGLR